MLAVVTFAGLVLAVVVRRVPAVRSATSTATSTILVVAAACAALVLATLVVQDPGARAVVAAVAVVVLAPLVVAAGAWVVVHVVRPLAARRAERARDSPTVRDRLLARAARTPGRVRGVPVAEVALRAGFRSADVRVTGLAAEMSYYGLISLVPLTTALGASLGFLRPLLGDEQVDAIRRTLVDALTTVFAEQVAVDVLAPLVDGLLDEARTGFALGAFLVALWLASRVFRAAVRALDDAYQVERRRGVVAQYVLGLTLALGAVATLVLVLGLVVVGPLLGDGATLADRLGLGQALRVSWDVLRWPVVVAVCVAYLTLLYRYAPAVDTTWTRCVPGAVVGTLGVLLVSSGFGLYLALAVPETPGVEAGAAALVRVAGQMLGLVLAGVLWLWLSSIAVLAGGVLTAELELERAGAGPDAGAADATPG
ncbi:YihY/virulence factor BrkB family protein [Cellulosimicrobium marinum]|uniref:YihY/virulence factor BrkB family protein n=1 Tax=Cellulosimicrobium marinum TaxID=1638992 RepID=UPI001E46F088|nr:YihY/virulence factor BrkB family protein [Cellulosimicrobium marinum]MCB7135455.1 YihY/virulence factor BrkB family protein [Cellulosimicrobium marinum]